MKGYALGVSGEMEKTEIVAQRINLTMANSEMLHFVFNLVAYRRAHVSLDS